MAIVIRNITRAQILLLVVLFLVTFSVYSLVSQREEDIEWSQDQREAEKYEIIGKQLYVRDHRGYLYPKGYFDVIPNDTKDPFKDVNLEGQHSDTVLPECDEPDGVDPVFTYDHVGWIEPPKFLSDFKNPCWYDLDETGTKVLECIPYFYVIGMAKSGSTDLFFRIEEHPQVAGAKRKEQKWFEEKRFKPGEKSNFTYYYKQFRPPSIEIEKSANSSGYHYKVCGDGSPLYGWQNSEWFRQPENQHCLEPRTLTLSYIHHLTPHAKLILILRNPVDRLYSHYLFHGKRTGSKHEPKEFHQWASDTLDAYKECFKVNPFRFCMYNKKLQKTMKVESLTSSIYSRLILDILKIFPRNHLLILEMKDYSNHMKKRLRDVYKFLELDPISDSELIAIVEAQQKNAGRFYEKAGPMLNETRQILNEFFKPFNEELAQMMQDDKYLWRGE